MRITESQLRKIVKEAMGAAALTPGDVIDTPEKYQALKGRDPERGGGDYITVEGVGKATVAKNKPAQEMLYYVLLDDMEQKWRELPYRNGRVVTYDAPQSKVQREPRGPKGYRGIFGPYTSRLT